MHADLSRLAAAALVALLATACERAPVDDHDHADETPAPAPAISNRVDIGPARRDALSLSFARAEMRPIGRAWSLPGVFEPLPEAVHVHPSPVSGRVELFVREFDRVEAGAELFAIDSPDWHELQHELSEALGRIQATRSDLSIAQSDVHEAATRRAALEARITALANVDVRRAELESELATLAAGDERRGAAIGFANDALVYALEHYEGMLDKAAALTGTSAEELDVVAADADGSARHRWWTIDRVVVRARRGGVVEHLAVSDGAWLQTGTVVASTVEPTALRLVARVTQSEFPGDLAGLSSSIAPEPIGAATTPVLRLVRAPRADEVTRRERLFALEFAHEPWMLAGRSAWLLVRDESAPTVLALPRECIQRDGLSDVFFRRDPDDSDRAIRVEADLGASDGTFVEVKSGLRAGDEVVLEGAWELNLAASLSGVDTSGGHFHADGTFHAGPEEH